MLLDYHQIRFQGLQMMHMPHMGVAVLGPPEDLAELADEHVIDVRGLALVAVVEEQAGLAPL